MQLRIQKKILALLWFVVISIQSLTAQVADSSGTRGTGSSLPPAAPTPSSTGVGVPPSSSLDRINPQGVNVQDIQSQIENLRARGASDQLIQQIIRRFISQESDSVSQVGGNGSVSGLGISSEVDSLGQDESESTAAGFSTSGNELLNAKSSYDLFLEQQLIQEEQRKLAEMERRRRLRALVRRQADSVAYQQEAVFGQHIFSRKFRFFNWQLGIIPQEDYILGPGDRLIVAVWGSNELFETLTVDEDGTILRQFLGKIPVAGYKFEEAVNILTRGYRNFVGDANIDISLDPGPSKVQLRVDLVGNVQRPGPYSVDPGIDVLRAIFNAGGVSEKGSIRNIEIKRGGRRHQLIDLYDYLLEGASIPKLEEDDHVVVPVQGKLVQIMGDVVRPMFYELKPEEDLKALIDYAGGIDFDARTSYVKLIRFTNGERSILDINLADHLRKGHDFPLAQGDQIIINQQTNKLKNVVEVQGNVQYPGLYPLKSNITIKELINEAGGLDSATYMKRAYLTRFMPSGGSRSVRLDLSKALGGDPAHNFSLQDKDVLRIFSNSEFQERQIISIEGLVQKPDTFQKTSNMTLKDLLYLAGGFKKDADLQSIELSTVRLSEMEDPEFYTLEDTLLNTVVDYVSVSSNWQEDPYLDTVLLNDYQEVRVYSIYDFGDKKFLQVEGAVVDTGLYQVDRNTSLKSLLYQAGGIIFDEEVRNIELYTRINRNEQGYFGTEALKPEIVRIAIDDDWRENPLLDSIVVSPYYKVVARSESSFAEEAFVKIKGLVREPGRFKLVPNMTLRDLLFQAGGMRLGADLEKIELTRVIEVESDDGKISFIPISISQISTKQDWIKDDKLDEILLNPYDEVYIRSNPEFKLQETIFIEGEVIVPGEYTKVSKDERLSSLVSRAEGITEIAYPEGAYLIRPSQGVISLKLEHALRNVNSKYNIPLLSGDRLVIPPRTEIVTITGNVLQPATRVIFEKGNRKFKHYVNLAGGFDRRTKKKLSTVSYVDGSTKRVRTFLFFKFYPVVEQGSIINIATKPEKEKKNVEDRKFRFSFQEVLASATAILTFYLLIDRTFENNDNN